MKRVADFYEHLSRVTQNPSLYNKASKSERKLLRDLRLKRIELILDVNIKDPTFIERMEVALAQGLLFDKQKFIGPGTNLRKYLQEGVLPKSKLDQAALKHDLAYLYASTITSKAEKRKYVREADLELTNVAEAISKDLAASEHDKLNAGLTLRLIKDLKSNFEQFIDLNFEGVSPNLDQQQRRTEFMQIIKDLHSLVDLNPSVSEYSDLLIEAQSHVRDKYYNLTRDDNYLSFNEKFDLIKEMRRKDNKTNPGPATEEDEKEERKVNRVGEARPGETITPSMVRSIEDERLKGFREQYGLLQKPVMLNEGATAIVAQNEAAARTQERINILPQVITGERILRTLTYRDTGLSVLPSDDAEKRNRLFLAKFSRVADGAGDLGNNLDTLANQINKPLDNSLIKAWKHNQELRYAGKMFDSGSYIQPKKIPTQALLTKYRPAIIASTPTYQEMIPTQAVGYTRPGRQFVMMNNSNNRLVTPTQFRQQNRLIFPQIVDSIPT